MSHTLLFSGSKRICQVTIKGQLNIMELKSLNQELKQAIVDGIEPIHFIIDISAIESLPLSLAMLQQQFPLRHSKVGWIILIGGNPIVQFLIGVVTATQKVKFRKESSLAAAQEYLNSLEETVGV